LKSGNKKYILDKLHLFYQNHVSLFSNKSLKFLTDILKEMLLIYFDNDEIIEYKYPKKTKNYLGNIMVENEVYVDEKTRNLMDLVKNNMMILMKGEVS